MTQVRGGIAKAIGDEDISAARSTFDRLLREYFKILLVRESVAVGERTRSIEFPYTKKQEPKRAMVRFSN